MNPVRHLKLSLFPPSAVIALEAVGYSLLDAEDALITPGQASAIRNPQRIAAGAAHV